MHLSTQSSALSGTKDCCTKYLFEHTMQANLYIVMDIKMC